MGYSFYSISKEEIEKLEQWKSSLKKIENGKNAGDKSKVSFGCNVTRVEVDVVVCISPRVTSARQRVSAAAIFTKQSNTDIPSNTCNTKLLYMSRVFQDFSPIKALNLMTAPCLNLK